jgi:hypothetical protein
MAVLAACSAGAAAEENETNASESFTLACRCLLSIAPIAPGYAGGFW